MDYTEFVIDYAREHSEMNIQTCARACEVAWQRWNNQPTGDNLQWWMQDTTMRLDGMRAMESIGFVNPVIQAARELATKKIGFSEFKRIVRENS